MSATPHFVVLCTEDRQDQYRSLVGERPYRLLFFSSVEPLLAQCLKSPPLAIIVDMRSQISVGPQSIKKIFNLKTVWPVMRCNVHADGSATVMCLEPHRTEEFTDALAGIAAGDESWIATGKFRQFLRLSLCLRSRLRKPGQPWERGNTLDISVQGTFIVNYHDHEKETPLELELYDLTDHPLKIEGVIKWIRPWDRPGQLPGVGVSFDPCPDLQTLTEQIGICGPQALSS